MKTYEPWPEEKNKELVNMRLAGVPVPVLMEHFGVPAIEIYARLNRLGELRSTSIINPDFECALAQAVATKKEAKK